MKKLIILLFVSMGFYPALAQGITGDTNVCASTAYSYSVTLGGGGGIGAGVYAWYMNGTKIKFVTGPNVTLTMPASGTSATVSVTYTPDVGSPESYSLVAYMYSAGTVSLDYSEVCYGSWVGITVTGSLGSTIWQKKEGAGAWTDISTPGTPNPLYQRLYETTMFRMKISECGNLYSNEVTATVDPVSVGGTIATSTPEICNSGSALLSISGYTGTITNWQVRTKDGTGSWSSWSSFSTASGSTNSYSVSAGSGVMRTYEFKATVTSGVCTAATSSSVSTVVYPTTVAGTVSSNQPIEVYGVSSATLTLSGYTGTIIKWQKQVGATVTDISSTSATLAYSNITVTTKYRAVVKSGSLCATENSTFITITIYDIPNIVFDGPDHIAIGTTTGVHTNTTCYSYQWKKDTVSLSGKTTNTLANINRPGSYTLRVRSTSTSPFYETGNIIIGEAILHQPIRINYVITNSFLKPGITESTDLFTLTTSEIGQQIQYIDGLGRNIQNTTVGASPQNGDMIQPIGFDWMGRASREFLPYSRTARDGRYDPHALDDSGYAGSAQHTFYQSAANVAHDDVPYSEIYFEPSPLNRPDIQFGTGEDWRAHTKYSQHAELTNIHGTSSGQEKIIAWKVNNSRMPIRSSALSGFIETGGYYSSTQLSIKSTKDEHGKEVREYTDKEGHVILKKVQYVDSPTLSNKDHWAQTYYIYDEMGSLRFVLPPELTKKIYQDDSYNPTAADLGNWAFQYHYDKRKRMIKKLVPGADTVYMVYDLRDRLVLTQDGNQRAPKRWLFTKYDILNRPVATGIYTHSTAIGQEAMSALISPINFYETYNAHAYEYGYSIGVFPTTSLDFLTVNFYDTYEFNQNDQAFFYTANELTGQNATNFTRTRGMSTGSLVKVSGSDPYWVKTVSYYDDKGRVIQTISDHGRLGTDRATTVYDFSGKVLRTKSKHFENRLSWTNLTHMAVKKDRLTESGGAGWGDASAASVESLPASTDGWVETTYSTANNYSVFGLSHQQNAGGAYSIDFGVYQSNTNPYYGAIVFEAGSQVYGTPFLKNGDKIRVERVGTAIHYKVNGITVYTSANTSSGVLYANAAAADQWSFILHPRASFVVKTDSIMRRFEYDHTGRLLKTWHKVQNNTEVLLTQNEYNALGQLVDKKLHSTNAGTNFKQSVDYRYNIRGWLTKINESNVQDAGNLAADGSGVLADLFGMELGYNLGIGTTNGNLYNGNISGMKWSKNLSLGLVKDVAYNYAYDPLNRIASATYKKDSLSWVSSNNAFDESGYSYDMNGNIMGLTRKGSNGSNGTAMDVLAYDYGSTPSNKLLKVSDSGNKTKGFVEPSSTSGNDYDYDANGNMIIDKNKDITGIYYNHLNLPVYITKSSGDYLLYAYDATGRKVAQDVYNSSYVLTKNTEYSGEYFYENDTLKFINHEEGRIVMTSGTPEYQYHLKDHLGNVRLTFTSKETTTNYTTNFEATSNTDFENYSSTTFDLVDHTDAGGTTYQKVQYLNGGINGRVGLAKSFKVMPGDEVTVSAYCKYMNLGSTTNSTALIVSLAAAFGVSSSSTGEGLSIYNGLSTFAGLVGGGEHTNDDDGVPKVFATILFFDENHHFVDAAWKQVTATGAQTSPSVKQPPHDLITKTAKAPAKGYAYVFLSNEHPNYVDVYFDDATVSYTPSPVVQMEDYYPFGLAFNSYQRESSVLNNYSYNGKERQDELDLGWMDYGARMYMPEIARWGVKDPLSEKMKSWSPYCFAFNNPIRFNDPSGMAPEETGDKQSKRVMRLTAKLEKQINKLNQLANKLSKDGLNGKEVRQLQAAAGKINSGKTLQKLNEINKGLNSSATNMKVNDNVKIGGGIETQSIPFSREMGGVNAASGQNVVPNSSLPIQSGDVVINTSVQVSTSGNAAINVGIATSDDIQVGQVNNVTNVVSGVNLNTTSSLPYPLDPQTLNNNSPLRSSPNAGMLINYNSTSGSGFNGNVSGSVNITYYRPLVLTGVISN